MSDVITTCWRCSCSASADRPVADFRIFLVDRGSGPPAKVLICGDCQTDADPDSDDPYEALSRRRGRALR